MVTSQTTRYNALDQALDVAGSLTQSAGLTLANEPNFFGVPVGVTGTDGYVSAYALGIATITGLTGMTTDFVGRFMKFTGGNVDNTGTFLICKYNSATSVDIVNATPAVVDIVNPMAWVTYYPYSLEDDINYARTDRQAIKGVNYYAAIPTYERPDAIGTPRPTNLANIAGMTTDARGFIVNRVFIDGYVNNGNAFVTLTSTNNFRHSDATNKTGVPCFDAAPYTNNWTACYVRLENDETGTDYVVKSGIHAGEEIFGITKAGGSSTPDSIEVHFYSCPQGEEIDTFSTAYTWETGMDGYANFTYGYFDRLDLLPDDTFRIVEALGLQSDAGLRQDVTNILQTIGTTEPDTSLAGLLTPATPYYIWSDLPDATPSVVEALNTINTEVGDRIYSGTILSDGVTITASLQELADAIGNAQWIRAIDRLTADVPANTPVSLPGTLAYTVDGSFNGTGMLVFTRGVLRDPGPIADSNDYDETSGGSPGVTAGTITFYAKQKKGDHINYFIQQ